MRHLAELLFAKIALSQNFSLTPHPAPSPQRGEGKNSLSRTRERVGAGWPRAMRAGVQLFIIRQNMTKV